MAEIAAFAVEGTGKIENLNDGTLRYVHRVGSAPELSRAFGVRVPRESLQVFKTGKRYMQDGQLWRETENFVRKISEAGYTLSQSFPDFILREEIARKLLNGTDLTLEEAQNSVVRT
jgi:hypothetical protein